MQARQEPAHDVAIAARSRRRGALCPVTSPYVRRARRTTRQVAKTFALACRLLPREVRNDVYLLYLVFRTLDDSVDDGRADAYDRLSAVEEWCVGGAPRGPEASILAGLGARYDLPHQALLDFCSGMRDDLSGRLIDTEDDLNRYCYRVAGTVGITMAHVLGTTDRPRALPAAAALGKAMQRTNILRDIDEDHARGRVYVPRQTIERLGPLSPGSREPILRDQIARADALYDEGLAGVVHLQTGTTAIIAAAAMYREILRQIERDGYGRTPGRATVNRGRKIAVAAAATARGIDRPPAPVGVHER